MSSHRISHERQSLIASDPTLATDLDSALRFSSAEWNIFARDGDTYERQGSDATRRAFVWGWLRYHPDRPRSLPVIQVLTYANSHSAVRQATEPLRPVFEPPVVYRLPFLPPALMLMRAHRRP